MIVLLVGAALAQDVWVDGYVRADGTYVEGHYRSAPNATTSDNFSSCGNVNPYTGAVGTRGCASGPDHVEQVWPVPRARQASDAEIREMIYQILRESRDKALLPDDFVTPDFETREQEVPQAEALRSAIGGAMTAQAGTLKRCYDQALVTLPALAGRWKLTFLVTAAGGTRDVTAVGDEMHAPAFEACMVEAVARWRFPPIGHDQPVSRTLRFAP